MRQKAVLFIPGIMGTTLHYRGRSEWGDVAEWPVWSGDTLRLLQVLVDSPERLDPETELAVGEPLRSLTLPRLFGPIQLWPWELDCYGRLLDYLQSEAERGGFKLFAFGYDWRRSNFSAASGLAEFLRTLVGSGLTPIVIVTHSMGGLVARLCLGAGTAADIRPHVRQLVHIGTPILGAAKAFRTLRKKPRLGFVADTILEVCSRVAPDSHHRLMTVLGRMASLYELMPHETERVLRLPSGELSSPVDQHNWPSERWQLLAHVRTYQETIRSELRVPVTGIYSGSIGSTDHTYLLDSSGYEILSTVPCHGDGTVSMASAYHKVPLEARHAVREPITHDNLPGSLQVHSVLRQVLEA